MTQEHYSLKEQLEEMRTELKKMSNDILELTVMNKHIYEERQNNSIKLERIESEFNNAKGAISLLKGLLSLLGASSIAFCTWIVTSNQGIQNQIHHSTERISLLEERINNLKIEIQNKDRN